jgi:ATP-dependent RNA helicase DeaD
MKTFEELGLSDAILKAVGELGYVEPMPVQEAVIPALLGEEGDLVALAQTGTGKTAAFGLPLLERTDVSRVEPQAVVLCPTRELCLQIAADLNDYARYMDGLRVQPVYGGSSIQSQIRSLKRGVHIIVATPGRLIDLMERGVAHLDAVRYVVMDEADEMLNMGFSESIDRILEDVPEGRHTLLFSATMSPAIARIARNYLHEPREITIGRKNEGTANVHHVYYMVQAKDKYLALKRIVDYYPSIYGIIFCRTRMETQEIADKLIKDGYNAEALHGDLSQQQRDLTMQKFRTGSTQLLVATDVAARGIDVDDLTHVIHYGLPDDTESYTHRSGRTGRAGRTGTSIAIINLREKGKLRQIERIINKKFEAGVLPTGRQICEKQLIRVIDDLEKVKVNEEEIAPYMPTIYRKLDWLEKEDLIKRMVSATFNRFLEYYRDAPELEVPQESRRRDRKFDERPSRSAGARGRYDSPSRKRGNAPWAHGGQAPVREAEEGFARLFINVGKNDGLRPNHIIDMINRHCRKRIVVGRIDLMPRFSFFEVEEQQAKKVINALSKERFNGRRVSVERAE